LIRVKEALYSIREVGIEHYMYDVGHDANHTAWNKRCLSVADPETL